MMRFVLTCVLVLAALPLRAGVEIREVTSPGGITAWLVEEPSIPFVALEIRFRGGASLDAPGKRGAINLMTGLLEEGAGDLDARGFARAAESLAASFSYSAGDDTVSISARFLTENRDQALDLLRLSLVEPAFSQKAIDRVRGQVISGLRSDEKDPTPLPGARSRRWPLATILTARRATARLRASAPSHARILWRRIRRRWRGIVFMWRRWATLPSRTWADA